MTNTFQTPSISNLPPEIVTDILTHALAQPPVCALHLLCPEWHHCARQNPRLETILRNTRVDTYTLPLYPDEPGSVSTKFDHSPCGRGEDCIRLPVMKDPRVEGVMDGLLVGREGEFYRRELVRRWVDGGNVVVASQRAGLVGPLWVRMEREVVDGLVLLREEEIVRLLAFGDDSGGMKGDGGRVFGVDGLEKEGLPAVRGEESDGAPRYLFQRLRHLVVNTVPELTQLEAHHFGSLPRSWGPEVAQNLELIEERLEYERRANLLMRWRAMDRLESLCLDLRGYTYPGMRYLAEEDVLEIAHALFGMDLKLLVVAGLRSWAEYPGPGVVEVGEVETGTWDRERRAWVDVGKAERVNWWEMFSRAVRPGGRLVLVDKQEGDGVRLLRLDPQPTHQAAMSG